MTEPEVVDVDAIDVAPPAPEPAPPTSAVALAAPRERRSEVIRPLDPQQLVESFQAYQSLLHQLLDDGDWQGTGKDRFAKKSAWRKIATAFDLDVDIVTERVDYDEAGTPLRAKVKAVAVAPSGRRMEGDGTCTLSEFTGKRRSDPKLESNMCGTATTRAKNRAISDLVGMGAVSAEEVDGGGGDYGRPPYGDPLPQDQRQRIGQAVLALLSLADTEPPDVQAVVGKIIESAGGYFPLVVGKAVLVLEAALKERQAREE